MMVNKSLKKIVPPFKLCRQIPEGAFSNTVLVYGLDYPRDNDGDPQIVPRVVADGYRSVPAPTLQEIMEVLAPGNWEFCAIGRWHRYPDKAATLTVVAFLLWLEKEVGR